MVYSVTYGVGFPAALSNLQPPKGGAAGPTAADLIDGVLASGVQRGYSFTYRPSPAINGVIALFSITAEPIQKGTTGERYFFTDQTGVIRVETGKPATAESPPI
jgi:hypothetical protein